MATTPLAARCCCGDLSLGIAGEPVFNGVCHCANCKRRTGSAFGWQCYFREDSVVAPDGEAAVYAFDSAGGPVERRFCARCGTTLYWRAAVFPGVVGVAAGCLPPDAVAAPVVSASNDGQCPWLTLPEGMTLYP